MRLLAGALAVGIVFAQGSSQDDAGLLARIKTWAAAYDEGLQNFLCVQQMTRYKGAVGPSPDWKLLEHQELEVSYQNKKVGYHRLKVDGKTDRLEQRVKKGYFIPGGEFGALNWPFSPKAGAEFTFDHREIQNGRALCVYHYRVPLARTNAIMGINLEKVPAGHQGFVDADCETAVVRRVRIATDPAVAHFGGNHERQIPVGMQLDIRYEPKEIAGAQYLLPNHAVLTGLFNKTLTRADIDFSNYRKYSSSSNVSFDDVK